MHARGSQTSHFQDLTPGACARGAHREPFGRGVTPHIFGARASHLASADVTVGSWFSAPGIRTQAPFDAREPPVRRCPRCRRRERRRSTTASRHVHAMAPQLLRLARRPRKSDVTPISLHETLESIMTLKYAHAGVASRRWLLRRVRCAHAPTAATMRRTTSTATDSEWVQKVLLVRASNK